MFILRLEPCHCKIAIEEIQKSEKYKESSNIKQAYQSTDRLVPLKMA